MSAVLQDPDERGLIPWREILHHSWAVLLSTMAMAIPTFLALWHELPSAAASQWLVIVAIAMLAIVLSATSNYFNFTAALESARSARVERRALREFRHRTDATIKGAVESILIREMGPIDETVQAVVQNPHQKIGGTNYPVYVFAQDLDDKFRVLAATIDPGSEHFEMSWADTEGWFPDLLRVQSTVIFEQPVKLAPLNDQVQLTQPMKLGPMSDFNMAKIARDFTAAMVRPIAMPHGQRDETDAGRVFGTIGLYSNDPDASKILRDQKMEKMLNRIASEVAPWVVMYRSMRDLVKDLQ